LRWPVRDVIEPGVHGRAQQCGIDDGEKLVGLQAGAADQDAVYTMLPEERGRIPRFNAAAVVNG
jgi:hypothetical protein